MQIICYTVAIEANVTEVEAGWLASQLDGLRQRLQGFVQTAVGATSYAAQDPWAVTVTVKEDLGGSA